MIVKEIIPAETGNKENSLEVVKSFFKNKMVVKDEIKIRCAFRIGKGKIRPILVVLKTPLEKREYLLNQVNCRS